MLGIGAGYRIDQGSIDEDKLLLLTHKSMGNGLVVDIADIVFIEPERFDNNLTVSMAEEIAAINEQMVRENRKYILIGPGRWGSRDRFLGIPVVWPQISGAKVIVEVALTDFHPDASLGSHFFHNVTSMNVGYFSVDHNSRQDIIHWDRIREGRLIGTGHFYRHVRFDKPLTVSMDGRKGMAVISTN